jgi:hypothetical protein
VVLDDLVVLDDADLVLVLKVGALVDKLWLELDVSPLAPFPTTVTSKEFPAAQSGVLATFVCPAYPPPYCTFFPRLGNTSSTPSEVVHCPTFATNIFGAVYDADVPITLRYAQFMYISLRSV